MNAILRDLLFGLVTQAHIDVCSRLYLLSNIKVTGPRPIARACFINGYGLKLGSLHEGFVLMNFLYEQETIGAVERCAVGTD